MSHDKTNPDLTNTFKTEESKIPNTKEKMKFDSVLTIIGEFGPYQRRIYFLLCLPSICCAMHKLGWVFLGAKVDYRCQLPDEPDNGTFSPLPLGYQINTTFPWDAETDSPDYCHRYDTNSSNGDVSKSKIVDCGGKFIYSREKYQSSAFIDYELVCDRKLMHSHAQALFMAGILLGSIIFGVLSDRFGRRPIFFLSLVLQVVFGIIAGIAPDYFTFVIARLIVGSSTSGIFLVGFVIAMEMVGPSKRLIAGVVCQYFFTFGYLVTAVLAYLIRDWQLLQIAFSVPGLVFLSYWWFLPESIRWLLARGRKEEAVEILRKVAKENKVSLTEETYENLCAEDNKGRSKSILHVFTYPRLGLRAVNIFFSWFVNSGVYYGLSLNTSNLGGNDYFNFLISGAVEIPAYAFLLLSLNRLGRKSVLCGCMIAGGLAMSACALLPENMTTVLITLSMIGKCCITASYGVIYILTAENFPTVVRNAGVGTSSMFARVGGILSYYVLELSVYWKPLPLLIFGSLSGIAGLLALLIPETLGRRLPETLEDGEIFGTNEYDEKHTGADPTSHTEKAYEMNGTGAAGSDGEDSLPNNHVQVQLIPNSNNDENTKEA